MLSYCGLIKVLRVEAYAECTISLVGGMLGKMPSWLAGRQGQLHPCQPYYQGVLDLFLVLYRYLPLGMLDRSDGWVSPDGIGTRHVAYSVQGVRKC